MPRLTPAQARSIFNVDGEFLDDADEAQRIAADGLAELERGRARERRRARGLELIVKRREQVKRLERRVKALTTRLQRARRSLAALERAHGKDRL